MRQSRSPLSAQPATRTGDLAVPNVTIVVDVLNGFCKQGNLASPRCDAAIPKIREVIEERLKAGDHLIFQPQLYGLDEDKITEVVTLSGGDSRMIRTWGKRRDACAPCG